MPSLTVLSWGDFSRVTACFAADLVDSDTTPPTYCVTGSWVVPIGDSFREHVNGKISSTGIDAVLL
jgi:hypothetical protein